MLLSVDQLVAGAKESVKTYSAYEAVKFMKEQGNVLFIDVREPSEHIEKFLGRETQVRIYLVQLITHLLERYSTSATAGDHPLLRYFNCLMQPNIYTAAILADVDMVQVRWVFHQTFVQEQTQG